MPRCEHRELLSSYPFPFGLRSPGPCLPYYPRVARSPNAPCCRSSRLLMSTDYPSESLDTLYLSCLRIARSPRHNVAYDGHTDAHAIAVIVTRTD